MSDHGPRTTDDRRSTTPGALVPRRNRDGETPAYYDVPMLKPPVWRWEVAGYFFLGGLSAGSYLLARMADRFGGKPGKEIAKAGTAVAAAAFVPCPLLLIKDLGDPKRFHHMLRVFKPESPMSLGAWTLSGYGGAVALASLLALTDGRNGKTSLPARIVRSTGSAVADVVGIPLAITLAGYTGVLLSTTATPIWSRNPWLGPLFSASAIGSGAAAIRLLLPATSADESEAEAAGVMLEHVEDASRSVEAVALRNYLATAGDLAEPLTHGHYAPHLWGGVVGAGLVAPRIANQAAKRYRKAAPWLRIAGAALGLAGAFALRWAMVHAGHRSADDPDANRAISRG